MWRACSLSGNNNKHPKPVSSCLGVGVGRQRKPVTLSQQVALGHGQEHHVTGSGVTEMTGFSKGLLLSRVGCCLKRSPASVVAQPWVEVEETADSEEEVSVSTDSQRAIPGENHSDQLRMQMFPESSLSTYYLPQ